ncbi:UNVERIFIED_CONTAM: hypothetical protein HDU68_010366 [Siphonaria sp. JEL0065]|nr:hypothetical protein HDU68_010366 [Siphonaria sp. JEL0065]
MKLEMNDQTQFLDTLTPPSKTSRVPQQTALGSSFIPRTQHFDHSVPANGSSYSRSIEYIITRPSLSQQSLAAQIRAKTAAIKQTNRIPQTPKVVVTQPSFVLQTVKKTKQLPNTRNAIFSDAQIETFSIPSAKSFSRPSPTVKEALASSPLTIAQFAIIPPSFNSDTNKYNLDGTRYHPKHPIPSSPLNDLIDEILLPFPKEVDTNRYDAFDGTRIHPPKISDHIEFAKEFAEWDRLHAAVSSGGSPLHVRPKLRLNPYALEFVPFHERERGMQSAISDRVFDQIPLRKMAASGEIIRALKREANHSSGRRVYGDIGKPGLKAKLSAGACLKIELQKFGLLKSKL